MIAKLENVNKTHCTSAGTFNTNERSSINLNAGEVLVIARQSLYSKKTLLTVMGCIIHPDDGIIEINGKCCKSANSTEIAMIKLQNVGFIFQNRNLLNTLSVEENVAFPLKTQKINAEEINLKTIEILKKVDMYHHRKKMPFQLTSFEQKQTAFAKIMISNPKIIVCDNPTAFLDREAGTIIMKQLRELAQQGKSIVIFNHDSVYNKYADRAVQIINGTVNELTLL